MGRISHTRPASRPRDRLRNFLAARYRGYGAIQRLAADMGATPKAAENVLKNGHWPGDLHFGAIVRRFGDDVWLAVFAPEIEPVLAKLAQEEKDLEQQLAETRALHRQIAGDREGGPGSVASVEAVGARRKKTNRH